MLVIISLIISFACCIISAFGLYHSLFNHSFQILIPFININSIYFDIGLNSDIISNLLSLTVSIITFLVYIYSVFYIKKEEQNKFFILMNLFNFGILSFFYSPNLFQILIMWEFTGVISYLLVGFYTKKNKVSEDSKKVCIMNYISDICLFSGFLILSFFITIFFQNTNLITIPIQSISMISDILPQVLNNNIYTIIMMLFVISSIIKSAQIPFNSWLINAMSAPYPVTSLIHSSTLVIMGIFLLIRLYPLLICSDFVIKFVVITGILTAVITSLCALGQIGMKKLLAYSTSAQIGLGLFSLGYYHPFVGLFFLISHAFIKSMLFLCSGLINKITDRKTITQISGLRKQYPVLAICFIAGGVALTGLGGCGFNTKYLLSNVLCTNKFNTVLFAFIGVLTSLYISKLYFFVFEGKSIEKFKQPFKIFLPAYISIIILTLIIFILSFLLPAGRICYLYLLNLFVIIIVLFLYNKKNNFLKFSNFKRVFYKGFYISDILNFSGNIFFKSLSFIIKINENLVLNNIENFIKIVLYKLSKILHKFQNNSFQGYISYSMWILLFGIFSFSILYITLLNIFGV